MPLLELDTDERLYDDDDAPYDAEELLDFKGELEYPYNIKEDED